MLFGNEEKSVAVSEGKDGRWSAPAKMQL